MLKILNDLSFFFEDNYTEIHVRNYAKKHKLSPPTASKLLNSYEKEHLLTKTEDKGYHLYRANTTPLFKNLQRIYWQEKLKPFTEFLEKELLHPIIILYGSAANSELKKDSDIDIAVFTPTKKDINVQPFEKSMKREIHLFIFKNKESVSNPDLTANILNGTVLSGSW